MSFTVLVSTRLFDAAAVELLEQNGCTVRRTGLPDHEQDDTLPSERMDALLEGVDAWIVGTAPVTRERLLRHPSLKVIARRGVGYNTVDVAAAKELGRRVAIAPGGNEPAVADHAVGMMLALAKRLRESHAALQGGRHSPLVGTELYRKTVGLVGFGRIAQAVAQRVGGFEATILAYDPYPNYEAAARLGARFVSLPELLAASDYISLHLPLTQETRHLLDGAAIASIKTGAFLINTARGGLVDEGALAQALRAGKLGGVGLDVFENETDLARDPIIQDLLSRPNVIASAHAAGSSEEGLARTNRISAQVVIDLLNGAEPERQCVVV